MSTAPATHPAPDAPPHPAPDTAPATAPAIVVSGVSHRVGDRTLLHDISVRVTPGELVVVAGGSGAGKSTLLQVLAGSIRPTEGRVELGGPESTVPGGNRIAVVPQDDVIHHGLPLRRTLIHAAHLRLDGADRRGVEARVDDTLELLGLADRAQVRVGDLSGGQRKRASIAAELLSHPRWCLLDEPTSGLDPVSAAEVLGSLRELTRRGVTVVMATHDPSHLDEADRLVLLAAGGTLAFTGTPEEARQAFGVDDLAGVYPLLARPVSAPAPPAPVPPVPLPAAPVQPAAGRAPGPHRPTDGLRGRARRWWTLTRRSAELSVANPLTLAVLVGSPVLVISMMTVLFPARTGTGTSTGNGMSGEPLAAQTLFWMAFCAFFFGLTYGLLQVVTESAVRRRERFAGVGAGEYLAAKVTYLLPVLTGVSVALLVVLAATDRLPPLTTGELVQLAATLVLASAAGLSTGLLASAAVGDAAQATLALPMICFPQVLFAGAVVPVGALAGPGRLLSHAMVTRWAFESLGRAAPDGTLPPQVAGSFPALTGGSPAQGWFVLAALTVASLAGATALLRR